MANIPVPTTEIDVGVFIDVSSLSVAYQRSGKTDLSFSVISSAAILDPTSISIGTGLKIGRRLFKGVILGIQSAKIPDTNTYRHQVRALAFSVVPT